MQGFSGLIYVVIVLALLMTLNWRIERANIADRVSYERTRDLEGNEQLKADLLLHIRQDLKLIAFLLQIIAIIIGLGLLPLWF